MADDPSGPQTEVRTFLIADVRGYTRFTQTRGDEAAARLAGRFANVVQAVVEQRDGRLVELRGDEALVVFGSPRQAIRAAIELQARFVEETLADPTLPLGVGIGIDSGEAVPVRGGYRGAALNLAARLCAKVTAGQVLASGEVTHLARQIEDIRYVHRGSMQFKGIDQPTQVVRVQPAGSDPAANPAFVDAVHPVDLATLARRQRERRRQLVAAFAAVAVLGAGIGVVVDRVTRVVALTDIGTDAVGRVSIDGNRLHAAVKVGGAPGAIAADATSVWVVNSGDDTVSRIGLDEPSAPANTIPVGHAPSGVTISRQAVWVANAADRTVSRVNPRSRTVVDKIDVGPGPVAVAAGFNRIWVANALDDTVSVIDSNNDKVVATIPVGAQPSAIAIGFGSVWVADTGSSLVSRIDPRTASVVAAILVGNAPQSLAADPTGMWVTNTLDDTVSHIDVTRNDVVATVRVGHEPTGIAASGDAVWVANSNDDSISRVDPFHDRVVRTIGVGNAPQAATVAAHDLWVTARASARQHRGGTLRIVSERDTAKSFDPGTEFTPFGWGVLAVTNDGLVTYRRTAGPEGAQIVPDLALRMPSISDQGRTYTFQLRQGIRYSDGTTVRASDFRRSIERTIRLGQSPGFFDAILGVDRCTQSRCDLSRGVVADDAARTVTIKLADADPELLYKLALPFAAVVPPSVPMRGMAFRPRPGTGPYVISQASDKRVRLTRNHFFRPWSGLAQPDGYADVIDITIVNSF